MHDYLIAPSLLAANFACLGEEAKAVITAGADMLHLDVMDNHFVPNLTVGPMVCKALRNYGIDAPIDVHLMVQPVDALIKSFALAGASTITFHPEASEDAARSLDLIHQHGCKAGLALSPEISLDVLSTTLWDKIDFILVMSVNPGFGGQAYLPETLEKLVQTRKKILASGRKIRVGVDGGIKTSNIAQNAAAGADTFIAGSAIFAQPDYAKVIAEMRAQLRN